MNILAVILKQFMGGSLSGFVVCLLTLPVQAFAVQDVPNPRQLSGGWVADSAQILKPETEDQLNEIISALEAKNGAEIAVVTVPDTQSAASPKAFATELFNRWHIGKKSRDNGVLFLISQGDRRVEIETGYGVEAILPDARVSNIIEQEVTPRFRQGDFDGGTLAGTQALVIALDGQQESGMNDLFPVDEFGYIIFLLPIGFMVSLYKVTKRSLGQDLKGMGGFVIYRLFRRSIQLKPVGQSRTPSWHQWFENSKVLHCATCGQPLQPLPSSLVTAQLTHPQQVAEEMGTVQFSGWQCPNCSFGKMHLRAYETLSDPIRRCPRCHELTLLKQSSIVVQEPSISTVGLLLTLHRCQCCDYYDEVQTEFLFGKATQYHIHDDGGGGSFGGGSSDGGGAGGSW